MKPSAHNRWLERSFNKEDEPFDLGGSFSRDTVQPVTSFALCPAQRIGSSQLKLPSILPFFDICFALYLAGLPPAPWSGGVIASLLTTRTSINFSQHHKVYSTWLLIRQRPERSSMRSCDPWPIALGHAYATLYFKVSRPITPAVAPHYQFVSLRSVLAAARGTSYYTDIL